jgi:hypothetical protein
MKSFAAYGIAGQSVGWVPGCPGRTPAASLRASCVGRSFLAVARLRHATTFWKEHPSLLTRDPSIRSGHGCLGDHGHAVSPSRRLAACLHRINPNGFVCICLSPDAPAQRHKTIHHCPHTTPTNQTLTEPLLRETLPSAVIPRPRQILYFETPPARLQDLAGVRTVTQGREFPPGCDELSKTVNLRRALSGQSEEVEHMSRWCGPAFLVLNPDRAILSRQRE